MSDHWETFPCTIGERQAFITFDYGLRSDISELPFGNYARYELTLRDPDPRGLPRGNEFEVLNKVEDRLSEELGPTRGITVGRITTDGCRYVIYYTQLDEADPCGAAGSSLNERHHVASRPRGQARRGRLRRLGNRGAAGMSLNHSIERASPGRPSDAT